MRQALALASLGFLACTPRANETSGLSGGSVAVSGSSAGDGSTSSSTATTMSSVTAAETLTVGSDTSVTDGPKNDMGMPDLPQGSACNRKVDVVFVISQGGGVFEHLDALYASYPAFIETMQETFAELDLHVMVVAADGDWGDASLCPASKCPADSGCPAYGDDNDFPCWAHHQDGALSDCDDRLGAGVVFPAGEDASNKPCDLSPGQRFLSGDDPLFAERFDCIARLGGTNGTHQNGWALAEAVSPDLRAGCNAGFLRDDALLFAILIAGKDESPYNYHAWAERALEAKDYEQELVVALGIADDWQASDPPLCEPGLPSDPVHEIYAWTREFDHRVFGSIPRRSHPHDRHTRRRRI